MKTVSWKKGIINTLKATGGNVGVQAGSGGLPNQIYICDNDVSNHAGTPWTVVNTPECIFPPIWKGMVTAIEKILSVTEVPQIAVFGMDTETIVASTRYKLIISNPRERYEGARSGDAIYAYTSPAVLSGTAQTDRENVYTVLVDKINARANHVEAFLLYKVAFTTGSSTGDAEKNFTAGDEVTQETSAITAKVAACVITSGTFAGDDAAGTIYLYDFSDVDSWNSGAKTLTHGTAHVHTAAALTIQGMVIVDDAGYYPANPSMRLGPSEVFVAEGFTTAHFDIGVLTATTEATMIGVAGVVGVGQGATLLANVPKMHADKTDYASGDPSLELNAAPDAAKTYTQYNIHILSNAQWEALTGNHFGSEFVYTLFVQEDSGLTNHATFETALAGATGVTLT